MHIPIPTLLAILTTLTTTTAEQLCVQGEGLFNTPHYGKLVIKNPWTRAPKNPNDPNYEEFSNGKNVFFRQDSYVYSKASTTDVIIYVFCGSQGGVYYACKQGAVGKWPNYNCLTGLKLVSSAIRKLGE